MFNRNQIALQGIPKEDFDDAISDAIDKELAEQSLKEFIKQAWYQVLEPTTDFIDGWHIDAICEHLEAVYNGEIKRLLINIPPRTMKSIATSIAFPAWCWAKKPELKFLNASYAASLSTRDSVRCRKIIQSPWYQKNWGDKFSFLSDQNAKTRFENDKTGYRVATSVDGLGTGEGGDIIIVDDPHNVKDTFSKVKREAAAIWWKHTMSTRLNDQKTGAIVIIMQRVHEEDLSGLVLEQGGYDHLCLPMEYELESRSKTTIEFIDPRTEVDELLWPEKVGELELKRLKKSFGSPYPIAGQLQQRPAPMEGGIVDIDWFNRYLYLPSKSVWRSIYQFWDTAQKADEITNAPWAGGTFVETIDGRLYLADVLVKWMNYPDGKRTVKNYGLKWNPNAIVIEDKSTGSSLLQELPLEYAIDGRRERFTIPVIGMDPSGEGDKEFRMSVESPAIQSGQVFLPEEADWLLDFEKEIATFPNSKLKDQVDMLSMALKYFRETRGDFWSIMETAILDADVRLY